ncbi:MAG: primosomal replication protein N [Candidatus Competibacter sp.]|nr:primosomal replication protein N [Candidatus Competibacter sp.]MDG4607286.1 primosomal replication protein N [Candidatus Contendobacter sp.]HRD49293.1 primosomal replication protein N [Candidatus Contendobacter sp.]
MPPAPSADNCLLIAGQLAESCETRTSPSGVTISRFLLEHHSGQIEAGIAREARCRIPVMACGEGFARAVGRLPQGAPVRVRGFISRANSREGEYRLVLHAVHIDILNAKPPESSESS